MEEKKPKRIRPPVKRYGGKYALSRKIIEEFPNHKTYLEPFGGGGSVLLSKPPSPVETYNDLDLQITRIFRVLRSSGEEFIRRLSLTPYSEVEFADASELTGSDVEKAVATFIRLRQSFAAIGRTWGFSLKSSAQGMSQTVNQWLTAIDALPEIIQRLKQVQITCQPAIRAIKRFDSPDTLIYCDPPYLHGTRAAGSRNTYDFEMTDQEHRELADVLNTCKSKIIISGYPSKLYDELYRGWRTKTFTTTKHGAAGPRKPRATECLWMNF